MLDAVAEHVLSVYVGAKAIAAESVDPVADLKAGWETNVGFGLANPEPFGLLIAPGRAVRSPAAAAGLDVLRNRDLDLTDAMFEAVARAILTDVPALDDPGTVAAAVTFRTVVPDLESLSDAERALLSEWLDRAAETSYAGAPSPLQRPAR